jgi:type 1 fimbriae regulatory protein FimB
MSTTTYLNSEQMLSILHVARQQYGAREHAMFLLAFRHGLRASEIAHLKVSDVANGHIDIRRLKDSLRTVQPLQSHPNPLLDEPAVLVAWLAERGDGDGSQFLFTSRQGSALSRRQVHRLFESIAIRAGIPAGLRNPHQCKHALASLLIRSGVSLAHVQQALGHKHVSSTVRYTHISQAEAAVKVNETMAAAFAA